MDEPKISVRTVRFNQVIVENNNNVADIDDVINVLTVLTNSDKELNFFDKPEATEYLKAAGLISEPQPHQFKLENMEGCRQLNDQLSTHMEKLIDQFNRPNVLFNSSHEPAQ